MFGDSWQKCTITGPIEISIGFRSAQPLTYPSSYNMTRRDGRGTQELRQLALESGLLSRADGSAKFSCGKFC